jgi:hypothetical protein
LWYNEVVHFHAGLPSPVVRYIAEVSNALPHA